MKKVMWRTEITFVGQETGKICKYQATRVLLETGTKICSKLWPFFFSFIYLFTSLIEAINCRYISQIECVVVARVKDVYEQPTANF